MYEITLGSWKKCTRCDTQRLTHASNLGYLIHQPAPMHTLSALMIIYYLFTEVTTLTTTYLCN